MPHESYNGFLHDECITFVEKATFGKRNNLGKTMFMDCGKDLVCVFQQ
jgi:hypothetical protein